MLLFHKTTSCVLAFRLPLMFRRPVFVAVVLVVTDKSPVVIAPKVRPLMSFKVTLPNVPAALHGRKIIAVLI